MGDDALVANTLVTPVPVALPFPSMLSRVAMGAYSLCEAATRMAWAAAQTMTMVFIELTLSM